MPLRNPLNSFPSSFPSPLVSIELNRNQKSEVQGDLVPSTSCVCVSAMAQTVPSESIRATDQMLIKDISGQQNFGWHFFLVVIFIF